MSSSKSNILAEVHARWLASAAPFPKLLCLNFQGPSRSHLSHPLFQKCIVSYPENAIIDSVFGRMHRRLGINLWFSCQSNSLPPFLSNRGGWVLEIPGQSGSGCDGYCTSLLQLCPLRCIYISRTNKLSTSLVFRPFGRVGMDIRSSQ